MPKAGQIRPYPSDGPLFDNELLRWATDNQREIILRARPYFEGQRNTLENVSAEMGYTKSHLHAILKRVQNAAARYGYSPDEDRSGRAPDGYKIRGKSTYYDREGTVRGQWVKTTEDAERQAQIMRETVAAMCEDIPRAPPVEYVPRTINALYAVERIANVYTFTDCHLGMNAWHEEGGANWDLDIAERTLRGTFSAMMAGAPPAKTGIIAQLGDFLHYDGLLPITPTSGHVLDSDGRLGKIVRIAIRTLRHIIDSALSAHERVILLAAEGNHDISSSVWLRNMFAALYEIEPRLTVISDELPFYAHQHGQTGLFWHHGHMKKSSELPLLMAAQFPEIWGKTTKRYAHVGHTHREKVEDYSGIKVIHHPTMAARDSYAARHGYHSLRAATCMTFHDEFGRVSLTEVCPEMLEADNG